VTAPGRLAVLVPTTGAVLRVLSLVPRPGLPHGAAFAEGDYRPLPLSPDYRALAGPEGPIAKHLGRQIEPHELRLSGAPESGRSWEAPVALAHLLLARGWSLVPDPAEADLVIWATGAVDLDLTLLPGDYAPERKVALSTELLTQARRVLTVLPPGPGREAAEAALTAAGIPTLSPRAVPEVLAALIPASAPTAAKTTPMVTQPRAVPGAPALIAATLVIMAVAAVGISAFDLWPKEDSTVVEDLSDPDPPAAGDTDKVAAAVTDQTPEPPSEELATTAEAKAEKDTDLTGEEPTAEKSTPKAEDITAEPVETMPTPPPVTLSEIHARPGATCRAALFDPETRDLKPLAWTPNGFPPSTYTPGLCGIALATGDGGTPPPLTTTPPDAFLIVDAPPGSLHAILREGVQNVVYTFPDPRDGATLSLRHEITAPN
jgi:hypothetical protein